MSADSVEVKEVSHKMVVEKHFNDVWVHNNSVLPVTTLGDMVMVKDHSVKVTVADDSRVEVHVNKGSTESTEGDVVVVEVDTVKVMISGDALHV